MRQFKILLVALNLLLAADIIRCFLSDSLHRECALGNSERVAELVADGADVDEKVNGMTPLVLAVGNGHLGVVRVLVEAGADVNMREYCSGKTPLEAALDKGHEEIARYLIEHGADPNTR